MKRSIGETTYILLNHLKTSLHLKSALNFTFSAWHSPSYYFVTYSLSSMLAKLSLKSRCPQSDDLIICQLKKIVQKMYEKQVSHYWEKKGSVPLTLCIQTLPNSLWTMKGKKISRIHLPVLFADKCGNGQQQCIILY